MPAPDSSHTHLVPVVTQEVAITDKLRKAVFKAWGERCAYCRVRDAEHVDHIFPSAKGGPDALENFAAACETCNQMKSDMILGEGIIAIISAKAAKKAPAIRRALAPKRRACVDRDDLLAKLVDATCAFQQLSQTDTRDRAQVEADIAAEFAGKSGSEIKIEAAKRRGKLRRHLKAKSDKLTRDELLSQVHEALLVAGCCETAARMIVKKKEMQGSLETHAHLRGMLRMIARSSPADYTDRVDIGMDAELRAEFRDVLMQQTVLDYEDRPVLRFDRNSHPRLAEHFLSQDPRPHAEIAGWMMNLITGWSTYADLGIVELLDLPQPELLIKALERCNELDADAFTFRNPFRLTDIPPKCFCKGVPAENASFLGKIELVSRAA